MGKTFWFYKNLNLKNFSLSAITLSALPTHALAGDFEGTLQNLVNALIGKILPIFALGYLGKNIFGHIQGAPEARQETIRVVVAIACLIGINSVWSYIKSQVR
ncbi:MAG: hypothetical protein HY072_05875 [Deltaproteobacteria bacterium]|nr:hypothetical protein [Deltaproteobacteria bacterium]